MKEPTQTNIRHVTDTRGKGTMVNFSDSSLQMISTSCIIVDGPPKSRSGTPRSGVTHLNPGLACLDQVCMEHNQKNEQLGKKENRSQ